MSWRKDVEFHARTLPADSLDTAWAKFGTEQFLKSAAQNDCLPEHRRVELATHKRGTVRAAFAGRSDLRADELAALLADPAQIVVTAALRAHHLDAAAVVTLMERAGARLMDAILRNVSPDVLRQCPARVVAPLVQHALTAKYNDTVSSLLGELVRGADGPWLGELADHLPPNKLTERTTLLRMGRGSLDSDTPVNDGQVRLLAVLLASMLDVDATLILNVLNSALAKHGCEPAISMGAVAQLQLVLGEIEVLDPLPQVYELLSSSSPRMDYWANAGNRQLTAQTRASAYASLLESGVSIEQIFERTGVPELATVTSMANALPLTAARELIETFCRHQTAVEEARYAPGQPRYDASTNGHPFVARMLPAAVRDDDPDLTVGRILASFIPQCDATFQGWRTQGTAIRRLAALLPLPWVREPQWRPYTWPIEVMEWLLRWREEAIADGFDAAHIDSVLESTLDSSTLSLEALGPVLRDMLAPAAAPRVVLPRAAGRPVSPSLTL